MKDRWISIDKALKDLNRAFSALQTVVKIAIEKDMESVSNMKTTIEAYKERSESQKAING